MGQEDAARTIERAQERRSQVDRSAEMQRRLVEATIELIVEHGVAGTTTRLVCERSGVSRGGLLHHFPTRADLLVAATVWLAEQMLERLDARLGAAAADALLDSYCDWIWETIEGPLFTVGLETLVAARTDASLRGIMRAGADLLASRLDAVASQVAATAAPDNQIAVKAALIALAPMIRGVGLDLAIDGDIAMHKRQFEQWRDIVRGLVGDHVRKRKHPA